MSTHTGTPTKIPRRQLARSTSTRSAAPRWYWWRR